MVMIGEYLSKVTSGNRVAVPKTFRKLLGGKLIVTKGFESHLILVNEEQFANLTKGVSDQPYISGDVREVTRFLLGNAYEIQPDAQGRFVLPEKLMAHANINDKAVFLGLGQWIEIWDESVWQRHEQNLGKHSATIANHLAKLGADV